MHDPGGHALSAPVSLRALDAVRYGLMLGEPPSQLVGMSQDLLS
jgi:hypothetical protein